MPKKLEVRVVQLEDAYSTIKSMLTKMDERLTGMDHVIRGNGTPGLTVDVATLKQSVRDLKANKRDWRSFIIMVVSGGIVAAVTTIMQHYVGR